MSLKARLTWAFIAVAFTALVLSSLGLNLGMYRSMADMHNRMMGHGGMMPADTYADVTLRWNFLSSTAAFAIAALVGVWTAQRITRPLTHLRDAVQHMGLRDLSRRAPVEGSDEIAELAVTFNRMGERLEAEERSRRQLLADTAHELRHPLAVLKGRLELMQDGKVPIDQEALLPLQDEVIRLTRLVGDLRDLSLAEVGGLSIKPVELRIAELLETLIGHLEPVAEAKEIQLVGEIPASLPVIMADPDRLRQVFINLISNALHHTPEGGRVQVTAWHDQTRVHVRVCDTGPGIPEEDIPHIFDRFYRPDKSRTRATGGSGLGLAIVRSLVELHHGKVQVESSGGQGICFVVKIPILQ